MKFLILFFKKLKMIMKHSSRQITSLLYYLCSAVFLNSESYYCTTLSHRKKISELIIKYKISENNPLQRNEIDFKLVDEYL